ncbi:CrcB protein [Clostridium acetobutylicum]|uniref:Fluoride-specific ion channel FluC 2 n=1 Tax=Clostridium acetobutylicum (strain ATCC 824 / DSM 792 / JCM 1419 / IAM 19013 / LMG 5710 / NBRC 13948 / NRRL B-527 / VKM B-1787 / 2291 / W) TaxID=272562 RepID=FLUC2_CLOAB|nr:MULTISPECIES: fluoride efflux transporter CrcB [Clostridium]Q97IQ3.1 RecName: Full=Fluoride-specific ion channel FluC 2 [Clostridium acetobutylicum ATCC 824]AAK79554.1 Integral membrane protein possibly involved in chromosome condensation [Clostridium acetobutylicum ATCC 824]ADZ20639.1 Integral membrane protein [Clostridium acetobutylicum EA 2018]AEI34059.1 camphor resistance protein CrcB [Clostridium acetobutylicum DSM 1731]AWV81203.1 fluoride efflux transporter CrcB [Clostridium acetobuty
MDYFLIGIGGACGSIVRYKIGDIISKRTKSKFPWGTFIINITGAFLLGIITKSGAGKNLSMILADGFLGAYTTFSTFMYEGFNLFENKKKLNALIYILSSIIIGILGFYMGEFISQL